MMDKKFLCALLDSCGTSADENRPSSIFRDYLKPLADKIITDVMGNTLVSINDKGNYEILLSAHIDEIGLQVIGFEENGLLKVRRIGGVYTLNIIGQEIFINSAKGLLPGLVVAKNMVNNKEVPDVENCFVDIFCKNREEATSLVDIGDFITFSPNSRIISDNLISKSNDDRCGVFIISQVLRRLKNRLNNVKLTVVSTTQEEIGLRGMAIVASNENPDICLNIDVTDASQIGKNDFPHIGEGIVLYRNADNNPKLQSMLKFVSDEKKIPLKYGVGRNISGGTDASRIQLFAKATAVTDISIPCKYMHSHNEVCSIRDIESCIKLIEEFVLYLDNLSETEIPDFTF